MEQHPVPQNITTYQFRLVGNMTLKQFGELAAGLVLGYLTFTLKIPNFIKFPLAGFLGLIGFALAFLPIQERPLDVWIKNFIKAIYSPTKYIWRKDNQAPAFLTAKKTAFVPAQTKPLPTKDKTVLTQYLKTLPSQPISTGPLDKEEQKRLENINKLFTNQPALQPVEKQPKPAVQPPAPPPTKGQKPIVKPAPPLTPPMAVDSLFPVKQKIKPEVVAMFSDKLAIPQPSTTANVVVGVVLSTINRILPNSLIEIKNEQGQTIRALKTNKLGQFFTAAPLESGRYQLVVEHEKYLFDPLDLKVEGKIISPLKIKAKEEIKPISNV